MRVNQALVLAGELEKRFGERTKNSSKTMQLINAENFLNNIIWNLKRHDINNIILCINYFSNDIKNYYKDGSQFGVNIQYIQEDNQSGTAWAIKKSKPRTDYVDMDD